MTNPLNEGPTLLAVILLLALFVLLLSLPRIDRWLVQRREARDARRRNQAHPWR